MIRAKDSSYLWGSGNKRCVSENVAKQNYSTHTFESLSAARADLALALVALDDVSPVFSARFLCTRQSVCEAGSDGPKAYLRWHRGAQTRQNSELEREVRVTCHTK